MSVGRLLSLLLLPARGRARKVYELLSDSSHLGRRSLYLNLGYWERAQDYDEACQELARVLAEAAGLGPEDEALDVGFGFADQDLYWAREFRPRRLAGLNITPFQVEAARRRVEQAGLSGRVELREGSATAMPFGPASFDKVLALECAFHFVTREAFFREAFRVLRPGGRLALADIVPLPGWPGCGLKDRLGSHLGMAFWQIPRENLYPAQRYRELLEAAGFKEVKLRSIREQVYAPFLRCARARLKQPDLKARLHPLLRLCWRYAVEDAGAYSGLDYLLVTAEKGAA